MYLLLNDEPYASVSDFDWYANGSIGCTLIGINIDTSGGAVRLFPIYKPWVTFSRRPGQFIIDVPLARNDTTLIISINSRWPFITTWKERIGLRKL